MVENQAKWRAICWSECSMKWHVSLISFDHFHIHSGQSRRNKVLWSIQKFLASHFCDEAALWTNIFCCNFGKLIIKQLVNLYVDFLFVCLRNSIEMHVVVLAIELYCYFTQSPSCIMTCSFALTKAWYRIAHEKVTSWLSFLGFKNNPPIFWMFFCSLSLFLDQF